MKKNFYVLTLLILTISNSFALTRGDVQIIEATENIQYLGQKITTDYFLLHKRTNDVLLQEEFRENIKKIEKNIEDIAKTTKNKATTHYILKFYRYNLEDIKQLSLENFNREDAKFMLDASKSFLEGARSIADQHQYKSSREEEMLMRCKELVYLIESVSKYYMAFQIGLKDKKHTIAMKSAIENINKDLKRISKYNYNAELTEKLAQIIDIWNHNKHFFINMEETTFPNLILTSNSYIKDLLIHLEKHHKQNL